MKMSWRPCNCADAAVDRLHRTWWMRLLFPGRRRYRCLVCNTELFVPPARLAVSVPPASQPVER